MSTQLMGSYVIPQISEISKASTGKIEQEAQN